MLGLKRGVVELAEHNPEWKKIAADTIQQLWNVLGSAAIDIQHVGSTAIENIKAKPIIDIAVAVDDFSEIEKLTPKMESHGFMRRNWYDDSQLIFAVGKDIEPDDRITTHYIHVVKSDSTDWYEYINFRDYLNAMPNIAKEYESLKVWLAIENPYDSGREKYLAGKHDFVVSKINEARIWVDFNKEFTKIEPITKGWSDDKKYYVESAGGERMFLRISDISELERKQTEYNMMERVYEHGILTPEPLGFGVCDDSKSCYSLLGWLDGEDIEKVLPRMPETNQYILGLKAGETLRRIHTIPAPDNAEPWGNRLYCKVQSRIDFYNANPIKSETGDIIVRYLQDNKHLLDGRPQTFNHGDYNVSNMMITPDGRIGVIDFNSYNKTYGDPWWELNNMAWMSVIHPYFYSGQIHGYFNGDPPIDFWDLFTYYLAYDALGALTDPYGINGIKDGTPIVENILNWTDHFNNPIPSWYIKDIVIQWIDGVSFKLKSPFDFSFLSKYGKVFKIFDDQDSGNICFGLINGDDKYFVKFAGAPTLRSYISTNEAIERMKNTVQIYRDLAHRALSNLIESEEIGDGFAMIFEWTDAECMGKQYPLSREKFMEMPIDLRLRVFDAILDFHAHVVKQGYVAIDFYDGGIMYDFNINRTILCDIEFYAKMPYTNQMGRMWGSSRFMSPEEFELGAIIDEITNVYTMGATAFALFGGELDRGIEKWRLNKELFDIAKRAVSNERDKRQQSIEQFINEWRVAQE